MPEVEEVARKNCEKYGSKFHKTKSMAEALSLIHILPQRTHLPYFTFFMVVLLI